LLRTTSASSCASRKKPRSIISRPSLKFLGPAGFHVSPRWLRLTDGFGSAVIIVGTMPDIVADVVITVAV
jgi:hypothetical protein